MCIPFASFENILWLIKIWLSSFKWSVSFFQFVSIYIFLETAVSHALWNILIFKCSKNVLLHKIATISKECLKQFDKPSIIWGLFYCVYSLALYICTSSVFGTFVQSPWILLFPEIGIVLFPLKLVPSGHEEKNKISAITFRRNAAHKSPISKWMQNSVRAKVLNLPRKRVCQDKPFQWYPPFTTNMWVSSQVFY